MKLFPVIGVTACRKSVNDHDYHIAGDKYLRAVLESAGCLPLIIPALGDDLPSEHLLDRLDGVLLTGSPSNIDPALYQEPLSETSPHQDPARDRTALPLIMKALKKGIPILGICRGFQEMNVALGGKLHQKVDDVIGLMDHREQEGSSPDSQYEPRHPVFVKEGGVLERIGMPDEFMVNSLHSQGIQRLAPTLRVEALAPDGLIEAFSLPTYQSFFVGVQWHPEWKSTQNIYSTLLFEEFGKSCQEYAINKNVES